jgi:hypothetical protein
MKSRNAISFCLLLVMMAGLDRSAFSQQLTAGIFTGVGWYSMSRLKEFQDLRMQFTGLPAAVTDDFPPYINGGAEIGIMLRKFPSRVLLFYQYSSTGARIHSMDYSGEIKLDLLVNANQLGTSVEWDFWHKNIFSAGGSIRFSYLNTEAKFSDYIRIGSEVQAGSARFLSRGAAVEPGVSAAVRVSVFRFALYGGYLFGFSEGLWVGSSGTQKVYLKLDDDSNVEPQWSGWRAAVRLYVILGGKRK